MTTHTALLPIFAKVLRLADMSTMNISLPAELKKFIDEQVKLGYGTSIEYMREPIQKHQDQLRLRDLLLEGAASPPAGPADAMHFKRLRGLSRATRTSGQSR
ncbi:MAG: ribbon-helix-helix domain-containing protein [Steroidobacteraceae bacterium]